MARSFGVLHGTQNGRDFAGNAVQVVDRADGLVPWPPEAPALIRRLLAMDSFIQIRGIRIRDDEVMSISAADQTGSKLPLAQLVGQTL